MRPIGKGLAYLKSIPSILKLIEFVVLLIAIGCVGYFLNKLPTIRGGLEKKENLDFFLFVVVAGWLLVMALFSLFVTGLHEKITAVNWPLAVAIISAFWGVLLLVSNALLADAARYYDKETYQLCDLLKLKGVKSDSRCEQLIGGTFPRYSNSKFKLRYQGEWEPGTFLLHVCGFIALALFATDTLLHFLMFMKKTDAPQATTGTVSS